MRKRLLVLALAAAACGGDSSSPTMPAASPTVPAAPQYPQAAGVYQGSLTLSASPTASGFIRQQLFTLITGVESLGSSTQRVTAIMHVAQSGAQLTLGPVLNAVQLPAVTGTVDQAGSFTPTGGRYMTYHPNCGAYQGATLALAFSGRSARLLESSNTQHCGLVQLYGTLTR